MLCSLLPGFSHRLLKAFVKAFFCHTMNCFIFCSLLCVLFNFSPNPASWITTASNLCSRNFFLAFALCVGLQFIYCCQFARLLSFQPEFFPRRIDIAYYWAKKPLMIPILCSLSGMQSLVFLYFLTSENVVLPYYFTTALTSMALTLRSILKQFDTKQLFCPMNPIFQYKYLTNIRTAFHAFREKLPFAIFMTYLQNVFLIFTSHFFAVYEGVISLVLLFVYAIFSAVLPIVISQEFLIKMHLWACEPIYVYYLSSVFGLLNELKNCHIFDKRLILTSLKNFLAKSPSNRSFLFSLQDRANSVLSWHEICAEVLTPCVDLINKLKSFQFNLARKKSVAKQLLPPTNKAFPDPNCWNDNKLGLTPRRGARNPNDSVHMFSSEVADPFADQPKFNTSQVLTLGPNPDRCMLKRQVHEKPSHMTKVFKRLLPAVKLKLMNNRIYRYIMEENPSIALSSLFNEFESLIFGLDILVVVLESSITEDLHGVVQKDLPQIFTVLVDLLDALEINIQSGVKPSEPGFRSSVLHSTQQCLYRLLSIYGPHMKAINMPSTTRERVSNFAQTSSLPFAF